MKPSSNISLLSFFSKLFVFLLLLNGCGFTTEYRRSIPYGDNIQGKLHQEKMVFPEIEVSLYSYNRVRLWEYGAFALPFIPIHWDPKEYRGKAPFLVRVGFMVKTEGFSFDPREVYISVDDQNDIQPTKYLYLPHDEKSKEMMKKVTARGFVACGTWISSYEFMDIGKTTYSLNDIGLWNCSILSFDISPPDPAQEMSIEIRGVRRNGHLYSIPRVNFKEIYYKTHDSAP